MKKRIITKAVVVAALAFALTGCGGNKESTTAGGSGGGKENTTAAAKDTAAEGPASTETATEAVAETSANWVFKKGDVTIELNAPADPVIQALGAAKNTYEAPSCAFDGMDVIYVYPGFEVLTYSNDSGAVISGVVLRDDTVTTVEGACIGMSQTDVENLYGQKASGVSSLQVDKGNCSLLFIFSDGAVSSIQYNLIQQ